VRDRSAVTPVVLVGLVPTIDVCKTLWPGEDVDAWHEAEHDGGEPGASR